MNRFKIVFNDIFFKDVELVSNYYSEISQQVKDKFALSINEQVKVIKSNPFVKSLRYDDVRLAQISKFPYAIHYSIDEKENIVEIHRLLSYYQSTDNWVKSE